MDLGVGLGCAAIGGLIGVALYGSYMIVMMPPQGTDFPGWETLPHEIPDNTNVAKPIKSNY